VSPVIVINAASCSGIENYDAGSFCNMNPLGGKNNGNISNLQHFVILRDYWAVSLFGKENILNALRTIQPEDNFREHAIN
jgi:hypothetical protein